MKDIDMSGHILISKKEQNRMPLLEEVKSRILTHHGYLKVTGEEMNKSYV